MKLLSLLNKSNCLVSGSEYIFYVGRSMAVMQQVVVKGEIKIS